MRSVSTPVIALVDDDNIFQFTASRIIKATNLTDRILQFYNGEEALTYLAQNADASENLPDVIFLDINMPFIDGWMFLEDYARNLKTKLSKTISIYMVSSSIDTSDINRAKSNAEVKDYVIKPISKEQFETLIKNAA